MPREIKTVGIVGLGTMGSGIAEVVTRGGLSAVTVDQGGDLSVLAGADLVIEALPENAVLKAEVLAQIAAVVADDALIATSASAISVTELAVAVKNPSRVLGLKFANQIATRGFVEIVRTAVTDAGAITDAQALTAALGLTSVTVTDRPGHLAHGLLLGYINHAVSMFAQQYATRDDIDAAMRYGCGLPIGPLAMLDQIGLDTAYDILDGLHQRTGNRVLAPNPVLKQMIAAGHTGVKSGRGFYTYEQAGSTTVVADEQAAGAAGSEVAPREVRQVAVIGSGTMANGIMEVFAKSGFEVIAVARSTEKVQASIAAVTKSLDKAVGRGKLSAEDRDATLARLSGTASVEDLGQVDLVVEAVVEDIAVKRELFAKLDGICKPGAILATTTSSLPVVECAAATSRPQDVVGLHFFNPAPIMRLVEIVTTVTTAPDVVATALQVCRATKKAPVLCGDRAGFIVNALLFPYLNDAITLLDENYASMDDIDTAITVGSGYPMGPFALLDVVGLDVSLAIERTLHSEFREPGFAPAASLEHLVSAGYLGRKTGRGYRAYA